MTGILLLLSCASLNDMFLKELPEPVEEEEDTLAGPARLECDAESLGFGALSVTGAQSETLTISCRNPGTGEVVINNLVTASDYFNGAVSTTTIAPGGVLTISVTFTPTHNDTFSDDLLMFTDAPASPQFTIPLSGTGLAPEVSVTPESLSFGSIAVGCEASAAVTIANIGTEDLTVTDLDLPAPFELDDAISLPWTITPGSQREASLRFAPEGSQASSELLSVTTSDPLNAARIVSVTGSGVLSGDQHDRFYQSEGMIADTLFAVSDSNSLPDDITEFIGEFDTFVDTLEGLGVDYRIAILVADTGEVAGQVDYIDSPTSATSRASAMLAGNNSNDGETLALLLQGIDANTDWLRDGRLNLIGISDEPDHSSESYSYYVSEYQSRLLDPANAVVHAIGGDYPGGCSPKWGAQPYTGMYEATVTTGGAFYSLCTDDWATLMTDLAMDVAPVTDHFRLTQPAIPDSIDVTIDGTSATSGWSYEEAEQAVAFTDAPEPGAQVEISYEILGTCP